MDQKFINLFDHFTHGGMNRREFMEKLAVLAGSTTAATALLPILENNYAHADILPEGDPRIVSESLTYAGGAGYFAKPSAEGKYPGVLVIHENRGLNPHIKDVARRMAAEGFAALAPDYLSDLGGTPEDADKARDMIGALKPEGINASSSAALAAVKASHLPPNGKSGAMGFCWGGGTVNALAVADPGLGAGVAYYGRQAADADVPKITAPLLLHYAALMSVSTQAFPPLKRPSRPQARPTNFISMRALTTPSTTTPMRRATTRMSQNWRGAERLPFSRNMWVRALNAAVAVCD